MTISRGKNTSWLKHGQVTSKIVSCWSQPFGKSLPRQLLNPGEMLQAAQDKLGVFAAPEVAPMLLCVHLSQDLKGVWVLFFILRL